MRELTRSIDKGRGVGGSRGGDVGHQRTPRTQGQPPLLQQGLGVEVLRGIDHGKVLKEPVCLLFLGVKWKVAVGRGPRLPPPEGEGKTGRGRANKE